MAIPDKQSFNRLEDLQARLLNDMSLNAESMWEALNENLWGFIEGKVHIQNSAGAEPGFYTDSKFVATHGHLKDRAIARGDVVTIDDVNDPGYLKDQILQNFKGFRPSDYYDKMVEKSTDPTMTGLRGYVRYILYENESDIRQSLVSAPEDVDYALSDTVLKDNNISAIVRAALVYERSDLGHEPWKKTHQALATQEFVTALLGAPSGIVKKV